jgi:hypothetical protein
VFLAAELHFARRFLRQRNVTEFNSFFTTGKPEFPWVLLESTFNDQPTIDIFEGCCLNRLATEVLQSSVPENDSKVAFAFVLAKVLQRVLSCLLQLK